MERCSSSFSSVAKTSAKGGCLRGLFFCRRGDKTHAEHEGVGPQRTKRSILLNNEAWILKTRLNPGWRPPPPPRTLQPPSRARMRVGPLLIHWPVLSARLPSASILSRRYIRINGENDLLMAGFQRAAIETIYFSTRKIFLRPKPEEVVSFWPLGGSETRVGTRLPNSQNWWQRMRDEREMIIVCFQIRCGGMSYDFRDFFFHITLKTDFFLIDCILVLVRWADKKKEISPKMKLRWASKLKSANP